MISKGKPNEEPATLEVNVAEDITMTASLEYKLIRPGVRKPLVEGLTGDDLHRKSGRWMQKARIIDRENDRYFEEVVDPKSGEVVRHCDEPLSQHRGHGSARTPAE